MSATTQPQTPGLKVSSPPINHPFRTLFCTKCGNPIKVPVYCKNRFCRYCTRARTATIRSRLSALVKAASFTDGCRLSMLTLTIPTAAAPAEVARQIVRSFRLLRQRKRWKMLVLGGAFVIEASFSHSLWHVHIHALVEAKYFPYAELLELWKSVSPGQGVYISRVKRALGVNYLTKYLTKNNVPEDMRETLNEALKDFRLFQPFGNWHGNLPEVKKPPFKCPICGNDVWLPEVVANLMALGIYPKCWRHVRPPPQNKSA
jgi:hypothetical protein